MAPRRSGPRSAGPATATGPTQPGSRSPEIGEGLLGGSQPTRDQLDVVGGGDECAPLLLDEVGVLGVRGDRSPGFAAGGAGRGDPIEVATDEHPRPETTMAQLAKQPDQQLLGLGMTPPEIKLLRQYQQQLEANPSFMERLGGMVRQRSADMPGQEPGLE